MRSGWTHFRIRQTGQNSGGNNELWCAGIEVYGTVMESPRSWAAFLHTKVWPAIFYISTFASFGYGTIGGSAAEIVDNIVDCKVQSTTSIVSGCSHAISIATILQALAVWIFVVTVFQWVRRECRPLILWYLDGLGRLFDPPLLNSAGIMISG